MTLFQALAAAVALGALLTPSFLTTAREPSLVLPGVPAPAPEPIDTSELTPEAMGARPRKKTPKGLPPIPTGRATSTTLPPLPASSDPRTW